MNAKRLAQLRQFAEQDPNDPFPRYALALEYDAGTETARAAEMLEDLLAKFPRYVPAYQQLGTLYLKLERLPKARAVLQTGMIVARGEGDHHAAKEMEEALEELE